MPGRAVLPYGLFPPEFLRKVSKKQREASESHPLNLILGGRNPPMLHSSNTAPISSLGVITLS